MLDFIEGFKKETEKISGVSGASVPPKYWFDFGNYALNRIMSGNFLQGLPQGRIVGFAGPSSSGKSFLVGNIVKNAQQQGAYCLVIDSENALDDDYMRKIGVDVENNYLYRSVITITHVEQIVSRFIKKYRETYGSEEDAPKVVIAIDSLDMLLTESELDNYESGKVKGDQGQRAKQLKAMLRRFVQDIKHLNISMIVTSQVYQNQDIFNGEGKWMVPEAIRYALSQIVLITSLKLKEGTGEIDGIRMRCEGKKTRFTKPYQSVVIEVPYESGMKRTSGLIEALESMDIVVQKRGVVECPDLGLKFRKKEIDKYAEQLVEYANNKDALIAANEVSEGEEEEQSNQVGFISS